jgi:hypothetical protein
MTRIAVASPMRNPQLKPTQVGWQGLPPTPAQPLSAETPQDLILEEFWLVALRPCLIWTGPA